jgi:PAS domain S-box-containing protein
MTVCSEKEELMDMEQDSILNDFKDSNSVIVEILNSMFDAVYVVDRDRRILFWNKGAEELTGYRFEDVRGSRCSDDILNHIDENGTLLCHTACPLAETLSSGKKIQAKVYPLHKTGKRFPTLTHVAPIRDYKGEIVAGIEVFRDISNVEEFRILQEKFNALIKKYISSATLTEVMDQLHGNKEKTYIRDLTVLYLDVVAFTRFSEKHSPEESSKMLNDLFGICEVITRECHGDIDKFIGDAVMAIFIDANDAVLAGTKVLNALSELNKIRKEEGQEEIRIRIGLNSGLVMQGEIGTPDRKDVTVIGDAVSTASRIESVTGPMSICISEATYSRLKDSNAFQFHEKIKVKNREESVSIFKYASDSTT